MTRQEIIARIKGHEEGCASDEVAAYNIVEVYELADGVLVSRESDGEYGVYWDKSRYTLRSDAVYSDVGARMKNFPTDLMGFLYLTAPCNWTRISRIAVMILQNVGGAEITWYAQPLPVDY